MRGGLGVVAGDIGKQLPGAVQQGGAVVYRMPGVFQGRVQRQQDLDAIPRRPPSPAEPRRVTAPVPTSGQVPAAAVDLFAVVGLALGILFGDIGRVRHDHLEAALQHGSQGSTSLGLCEGHAGYATGVQLRQEGVALHLL